MTALALPRPRPNLLLPLILLALAGLALYFMASYHAVMTHGSAALAAQKCFDGGGVIQREIMQDPITGRMMRFCVQDGNWYVSIEGCDGGNVTCYPRSFAKSLSDVISYAVRSGYTHLMGILP